MSDLVRIVGLGAVAIVALWLLLELVAIVFGIVSWIVSTLVSLAILAVALYVGYVLVTTILN